MKQAILITAYKDVESVLETISCFNTDFNFYIHFDRKSNLDYSKLLALDNVFISNRYCINWSGRNHLGAIILLAKEALRNPQNHFFHLITGEDFPIKKIDYFREVDFTKNYIGYSGFTDFFMDRINYFEFYDIFNPKTELGSLIIGYFIKLQKTFHFKREAPNLPFYNGSTYWSLNRQALNYSLYASPISKKLFRRLKYTFCAEEIFFSNNISQFQFAKSIINYNLRYIDWKKGVGASTGFLTTADYDKIMRSEALFARKIKKEDSLKIRIKSDLES